MALMHHLADNGSDGFVVCGTTGEASTLTDEEHLGADRAGRRASARRRRRSSPAPAPTTPATRSTLTERATELGADAMLSVTPYYNRPNRRGHRRATTKRSRRPPTCRSCSTTSRRGPARTCPTTCSPSSPRSTHIDGGQAGQRGQPRSRSTASTLYAGNDDTVRAHARHGRGRRDPRRQPHRRQRDAADGRRARAAAREIDASLRDVYETLFMTASPTCTKAALELLGHDVGGLRLPLVEADDRGARGGARDARAPRPAGARRDPRERQLRVLPLGGLGEIGKNMTVVEYDGRHRRRRRRACASRRPRCSASTSCCPTSATCASAPTTSRRSSSPTATRITSARCRGCCASSAIARRAAGLRRPADDGDGPLQARGAQAARRRADRRSTTAKTSSSGPFSLELIHMTHSIPDSSAVALGTELGTVLVTGDYKFDQTPVDGAPADVSRLAELGREGVLLLCGDSTNADRPGFSPSESVVGPHLEEVFARAEGRDRRHQLRLQHPPRPAGRRRRRRARPQGRAGRALDAQERRHRRASSATSRFPRGCSSSPARSRTSPTTGS